MGEAAGAALIRQQHVSTPPVPWLDTFCQALEQGVSVSAAAVPVSPAGGWAGSPLLVHGGHEMEPCSPTSSKCLPGWIQGDLVFCSLYYEDYLLQD